MYSRITGLFAVFFFLAVFTNGDSPEDWRQITAKSIDPSLLTVSGLALWSTGTKECELIAIHDNKENDQPRIGLLKVGYNSSQPTYRPFEWQDKNGLPWDLEAITGIPAGVERPAALAALSSRGFVYVLHVDETRATAEVIRSGKVPDPPGVHEREGFTIQQIGSKNSVVAVWAARGCDSQCEGKDKATARTEPATLMWSRYDLKTFEFLDKNVDIAKRSQQIRVDYPQEPCVREISDLRVDQQGHVFIASARECDDTNEAYQSAIYEIGTLSDSGKAFVFTELLPHKLISERFQGRKVEALEFLGMTPYRFIFGTDDEARGGYIRLQK
jgi:hypothetical protein